MKKIGIGICTYNREEMFRKCLKSLPVNYLGTPIKYEIVVVNDGTPYSVDAYYHQGMDVPVTLIQNEQNLGIGCSKNKALKFLQEKDCDYFFLIEDDQIIIDSSIFVKYIETSEITGIQHMMDPCHGPANKINGIVTPRLTVNYTPEIGISLFPNCVGAFAFYTKKCLEAIGLFDEQYKNGTEHLDHTYLAYLKNLTTPFWWFCSIKDPQKYIQEQACSEVNSVIRPRSDWQENIRKGFEIFKKAYGYTPVEIPDTKHQDVIGFLKSIKP